ncbi:MAG: sigma-70 family RNA polymerase sigma factor [Bacteroidales bacterium]|nr:sigma-70 family RNA polymerase sigma factor [Bacteroidales bacterium]
MKDQLAQEELYTQYAKRMFGVCLRYAGHAMEAQDILQEGFIRVFQQLNKFRFESPLENWIRRVIINTAISVAKRELRFKRTDELSLPFQTGTEDFEGISKLTHQEILQLIQELPLGYRTVFNLHTIEGYSHKEIGKLLEISENTSKSQLYAAKKRLREQLINRENGSRRERS